MTPSLKTVRARSWLLNTILMLASIGFSAAAFIALDFVYTAAMAKRQIKTTSRQCRVPDPVRHHALQPNCTGLTAWGAEAYQISTNSLGLRDEKIRQVPLADSRPRILLLGDSFTEGLCPWPDSFAGKIAAHFPQYDFLNGGTVSYSPSNYLNVARMVLAAGVEIDEVLVFIDISDTQDEAANYRDVDASGAVSEAVQTEMLATEPRWRQRIRKYLRLTNHLVELYERNSIRRGNYHLWKWDGTFDYERSAWTYRKVSDTKPFYAGYAPLGLEGGIAKEKAKMTLLWQELAQRHIPISVIVYPWPAQIAHDTADSRHVRIWSGWCEGKCKRFISLFPAFQAVKDQCPASQPGCWYLSLFIFGDVHYSPAGNTLVADAVNQRIEAAPPVKKSTTDKTGAIGMAAAGARRSADGLTVPRGESH